MAAENQDIIDALVVAYFAELETIMNYIANGETLDGVRAKHIKNSLKQDVNEELGHAQQLASRIKTIGGTIPGSATFAAAQHALQPPASTTDVLSVIKGVIAAEEAAIAQYQKVIELCDGRDYPTQDLAIALQGDEQEHLRECRGYLAVFVGCRHRRILGREPG